MIREFTQNDIDSIKTLGKYLNGSFDVYKLGENEKLFVYEQNSFVLGFIVFTKLYEVADLLYIVVDPKHRRSGIGKKLLDYICNEKGVEKVMLEVRESNKEALDFYQNNGFVEIRKIKNYYNGEDAFSMERSIQL